MKALFIPFFCLLSLNLLSQSKIEKEFMISEDLVPDTCLSLIINNFSKTKIKWLKEIGLNDSSIEAKFRFEGHRISVEFSSKGEFEDVEIEIDFSHIYYELRHEIERSLDYSFEKYKIIKIQAQYTNIKILETKEFNFHKSPYYEFIISTKENGQYVKYECLFNSNGQLIKKTKLLIKASNNLEY